MFTQDSGCARFSLFHVKLSQEAEQRQIVGGFHFGKFRQGFFYYRCGFIAATEVKSGQGAVLKLITLKGGRALIGKNDVFEEGEGDGRSRDVSIQQAADVADDARVRQDAKGQLAAGDFRNRLPAPVSWP